MNVTSVLPKGKQMSSGVETHFTKTVIDYDTVVDRVVMKNDELHLQLLRCIDLPTDRPLKFLDIGIGTGHGASLVLSKYPQAVLTGVDFSRVMLEKATTNLMAYGSRVELVEANINTYVPIHQFDVVISAITIHNLSPQEKLDLFHSLSLWLVPGGLFVNGDFCQGETQESNRLPQTAYLSYINSQLNGSELAAWLGHIENDDKPAKLSEQFKILTDNEFDTPKVVWQYENEAVYWARRK
jgi:tRNA (cmo5U34)-methyltransferase